MQVIFISKVKNGERYELLLLLFKGLFIDGFHACFEFNVNLNTQ